MLNGREIDWSAYPGYAAASIALFAVCLAGGLVLFLRFRDRMAVVGAGICVFVLLIQLATLGTLFINGEASALYEEGVFDRAGRLAKETRPAQGEYLVIGDHVAGSRDSRDEAVGNVRGEDIIGKIIC